MSPIPHFRLLVPLLLSASAAAAERPVTYGEHLLTLHNEARAEHKLPALKFNALLADAAQRHADHMAKTGQVAHDGIGDGTIESRIADAGYNWASVGENIAWGPAGASGAMNIWLRSDAHRGTLLGDYREVGFARSTAKDGKVYWVACFASPLH